MTMHAGIDHLSHKLICGWVYDDADTDMPLSMLVWVDDVVVARVLANIYRKDLEEAGFGNGRHGFNVALSNVGRLGPRTLRLSRESDGVDLPGSPIVLEAESTFSADMRDRLAGMLVDTDDLVELGRRAVFLAQQANRLLQRRADLRSDRPDPAAQRQFRVRWSGVGEPPPPEPGPRVLVINDTMPQAGRDAGSQAVISHMLSLRRLGARVTLAPADMSAAGMDALAALGIDCACGPWSGSIEEVLRRESLSFAAVYIHRSTNARYLPLIRYNQPKARIVYSVADLHHVRIARQAEVEARPELQEASQRIRVGELSLARFSDAVITHSEFEAALLRRDLPQSRIHVVPWHIPPRPTAVPFADRQGMAFIGSYSHPPNLDAAWWLVQEVMPVVRQLNPAITCQLVGSGMPDGLRVEGSPGIVATGHVPSLATVFDAVRLTVAPLNFGAGVKGKVLESLAAGVPCACTPIAAEGMSLPPPLPELVAADAEGLARLIVRLHDDAGLNAQASEAGLGYVAEALSEARLDGLMRAAMQLPGL